MSSSLHTGEFSPSDVKPGSGISRIWIYSRSERSNIDPDASAVGRIQISPSCNAENAAAHPASTTGIRRLETRSREHPKD